MGAIFCGVGPAGSGKPKLQNSTQQVITPESISPDSNRMVTPITWLPNRYCGESLPGPWRSFANGATADDCWKSDVPMAFSYMRPKNISMFLELSSRQMPRSTARDPGLSVLPGVAHETTLHRDEKVDVIVMLDVIEHLPDPRVTLVLLSQHLGPGGIIVITTGDFGSVAARLCGRYWRLMTPPQHLWFFGRESITRLAASLGLTVERVDHPWKIVPLSLIKFQIRRMVHLSARVQSPAAGIGLPVNLFDAM